MDLIADRVGLCYVCTDDTCEVGGAGGARGGGRAGGEGGEGGAVLSHIYELITPMR